MAATASSFPAAAAVFLSLLSLLLSFLLPQGGSAQSWILGHVPDHGPLWANTDGSFYHGSWSQMLLLRGRNHKVSLVTLARSTNPSGGLVEHGEIPVCKYLWIRNQILNIYFSFVEL